MNNKDFITDYLAPFIKAIDNNILDVRYIFRIAPYELVNITYKGDKHASFDITGKSRLEISRIIIGYVIMNAVEPA